MSQMSERNRNLQPVMERVVKEIEELRAELARMPKHLHGHRVYLDRAESLAWCEKELKRLDSLQERPAAV